MNCSKCGAPLREGCVYCSRCGQEAQVVSDLNILEDEFLPELLENEKAPGKSQRLSGQYASDRSGQKTRTVARTEDIEYQKRKKRSKGRKTLTALLICLAAAGAVGFGLYQYRKINSEDYLVKQAQKSFEQKNYSEAAAYAEKVIAQNEENVDAVLLKGKIDLQNKAYDKGEAWLLRAIRLDPGRKEAYELLVQYYHQQDLYERMVALRDQTSDEEMLSLITPYLVADPVFDIPGGTYSDFLQVGISTDEKAADIYYTTDGSVPDRTSPVYSEEIAVQTPGETVIQAVCYDSRGHYSNVVSQTYFLDLEVPDRPRVYPDGGQFAAPSNITVYAPPGSRVYYTWGNEVPTENSREYTGPIPMPEGNNILSVVAVNEYGLSSEVLKCNYIYYAQ